MFNKIMSYKKKQKGFTLLEIIIVIGILATLSFLVMSAFGNFRNNQVLISGANSILGVVKKARSTSLASEDFSQFGVHFHTNEVILFKGTVFSPSDPDNETLLIDSLLEISQINLNGGGDDVVFQRLTGQTSQYGTTTLILKSDSSKFKDIVIFKTGLVETN